MKSEDFLNQEKLLDDVTQINTKYCAMPKFVSGDVTRDRIGTFKIVYTSLEQETKIEIKVARQFTSDLRCIQCTEICSDFSLWIGDIQSSKLQHIQINGNTKKELLRLNSGVWDMAVTPGDDLLICIPDEPTLKQVSRTGEIQDTQYSVSPLIPTAVHVTSSNSVIIGAMNFGKPFPATGKRVVIVMDEKGNRLVEYELDSNNKPLFTFPMSITSTSEGNICAIDRLDSGMRGRVVVLSPTGNVLTTYVGRIDINNKIPFIPTDIITTTLNNIVVVDWNTDTIHILDSKGHFITFNRTKDFGIIRPFSVAVSTKGTIFIGCEAPEESQHTMKSKLYEVEFTGF